MSTSVEEVIEHAFKKLRASLSDEAITVHGEVDFLEQLPRSLEVTLRDISWCDLWWAFTCLEIVMYIGKVDHREQLTNLTKLTVNLVSWLVT